MGYAETTADFDAAIREVGDRFVAQVQPVLHPQSLTAILLDREGNTGRVAFTWGLPTDSVSLITHQSFITPNLGASPNNPSG